MPYEFSLPTKSDKVPAGQEWIQEIKYDGYRMLVIREKDRVRLISRGGRDWANRFQLIARLRSSCHAQVWIISASAPTKAASDRGHRCPTEIHKMISADLALHATNDYVNARTLH
jgi:hypothetical protein